MESLSDIETELRTLSQSSKYCELQPTVSGKPISFYFAEIADRIKAAAPTAEKSSAVGNAAATRETLEAMNRIDTRGLKRLLCELVEADIFDGGQINKTISAVEKARRALSAPLTTVTTSGNHHELCQPFIVRLRNNQDCADIDKPLSAISCSGAHHELCTPIIIEHMNNGRARSVKEPIGVQTKHDHYSLVQSFILGQQSGSALRQDNKPCPTISCAGALRKVDAIVIDTSRPAGPSSGHIGSAKKPIRTLTTCDNVQGVFAILEDGRLLDVRLRMLKPSELAAAHSFPKDYKLSGSRTDQVKQIGNSIPVQTAKAIVKAIFAK